MNGADEKLTVRDELPLRGRLDVIPWSWDYNPSAWRQRVPICLIAVVGFLIAVYMSLYQWRLLGGAWDPLFAGEGAKNGTETVLDSDVSEWMRRMFLVPDAAFGAVAYLGDAIFGLAGSTRRWQYRPWMVVLFGIDVIPLGIVSAVLVVLQGVHVGSWCFLCLATAAVSLLLVVMAYDEVWTTLVYLHRVRRATRSYRIVWKTFWGIPTPEAERVADDFVRLPGAGSF